VHLHRRFVNGWPRFLLSALQDPANLLSLVAVLDRIASESHTASVDANRTCADVASDPDSEGSILV
jgi:hypothetical protein